MREFGIDRHCCGRRRFGYAAPAEVAKALLPKEGVYAPTREADLRHVDLELDVRPAQRRVDGAAVLTLKSFQDGLKHVELDAADFKVLKVDDPDGKARFSHKDGKLKVTLNKSKAAGEAFQVRVRYRVENPKAGIHFVDAKSPDAGGGPQFWTQGQPEESQYWFPCYDAPQQKLTSEIKATVPADWVAISNGKLLSLEDGPRRGTVTFHWHQDEIHSVYLITLTGGRFAEVKDEWDGIPITYYCNQGREKDAVRGMGKTPAMVEYFSKTFGVRYPWAKYAQIAAAEFPGGMENTSATTQTDAVLLDEQIALDYDLDDLVAHELGHQWFGDLLTCKDWTHAWLNEGFATYSEFLWMDHDKGREEALLHLFNNAENYFWEDSERYRRPIVSHNFKYPWVLFDRHLYEKGGAVLHMLRYLLGDEHFFKAVQHYLSKHRGQAVETTDLIAAIREATGRVMEPFFHRWVFAVGYPTYRIKYEWDAKKKTVTLKLHDGAGKDAQPGPFKFPVTIRLKGKGWSKDFKKDLDGEDHTWHFKVKGEPDCVEFDPDRWILKKTSFKKPYTLWLGQLTKGSWGVNRGIAAEKLAAWKDDATVKAIADAIKKEKFWGARAMMVKALGSMKTKAARKALEALLKHKDPKTRRNVVSQLGSEARPDLIGAFAGLLRRDPSVRVRAAAAHALGHTGDAKAAAPLKRALKSKSWRHLVTGAALSGLASLQDLKALPVLRQHLKPGKPLRVRAAALDALSSFHFRDPEVVHDLIGALEDQDENVALAAVDTLGRLEDERAVKPLKALEKRTSVSRVKTHVVEALARVQRKG